MAAGVIADPARSRGRSRHGTVIDRLAGGVELVRAAKGAARSAPSVSRGADCSWNKPRVRPAASASLAMSAGLDAAEGEHLARGPVPPTVPPLEVTAQITYTCLIIPELG